MTLSEFAIRVSVGWTVELPPDHDEMDAVW
eukprot:SAG31_NODE_4367_length_3307_cov_2.554239_2_plen_30_part_00